MTQDIKDDAEKQFRTFVDDSIDWFKYRARRTNQFFNALRLALVIFSASLPAVVSLTNTATASVVAVGIAILAGLDAQFRPGEQWRHHRTTQAVLMRLKRSYERGRVDEKTRAAAFQTFVDEVETLLEAENEEYFNFRVTKWKSGETKQ